MAAARVLPGWDRAPAHQTVIGFLHARCPILVFSALPGWLEGVGEVALRTLVRVELPGRAVRLSITMDEALAGAVDRAAAAQGFTRSGFLAEAARRMLREHAEP